MRDDRIAKMAIVVIIGAVLQGILVMADCKQTPGRTALAFTKAYFNLDASMSDMLCEEVLADQDEDPVGKFLHGVAVEARSLGHDASYMRSILYGMHTHTVPIDDTHAEVHVKGTRARNINPVFAYVAKLFFLGKTYTVDQTLEMVKENGRWKVCGQPFFLGR